MRTSAEGKYVLVFDPAKKAFVLHRVDSLFHMNVVRLPNSTNADSLVAEFPRLEVKDKVITAKKPQEKKSQTQRPKGPPEDITAASTGKKNVAGKNAPAKAKPKAKPPSMGPKNKEAKQPQRRKKSIQNDGLLTLPDPAAAKAAMPPPELPKPNLSIDKKKRAEDSEEDDDDDDDGGLLVEYPDAGPAMKGSFGSHRAPLVPQIARPFSDFVRDYQEEADDDIEAEPEPELEDVYDAFNTTDGGAQQPGEAARALQPSAGGEHADWDGDAELEAELDAEFARAMQDDIDSESSVSEED